MSLESYQALINELCKLTIIPNPETLYEMASLRVREINFSLLYNESPAAGEVLIYCGFGPLPQQHRDAVMQRLLETNLHLFNGQNSPSFSYNPETGHVILVSVLLLDALDAQRLLDMLGYLAALAQKWRETYFLDNENKSAQRTPERSQHSASFARTTIR
ncbi:CesT family type III secretion system chaperone [Pseudomonas asuensis]|uniref:Uncharacterized protein n=1 Tax=Pseudomonas asuensis TaxID=1825787 RepID=A0ABQ2H4Q0_9PSED|nr:CesT family type III secretion system chaperone [Pseudomonas asuensis]GGM31204.1 hypothetical protein GCM10009425_47330 [Pseudomonas asuensis]